MRKRTKTKKIKFEVTNGEDGIEFQISLRGVSMRTLGIIQEFINKHVLIYDEESPLNKEVLKLIEEGTLLMAVKTYKEATGLGLKESKEHCDALRDKYFKEKNLLTNR